MRYLFNDKRLRIPESILIFDFIKTGIKPIYNFPIPLEALKDENAIYPWTSGEAERGAQVSEIWKINIGLI